MKMKRHSPGLISTKSRVAPVSSSMLPDEISIVMSLDDHLRVAVGLVVEAHAVLDHALVVQARGEAQAGLARAGLRRRLGDLLRGLRRDGDHQPVLQARGLRMPAILQACLT